MESGAEVEMARVCHGDVPVTQNVSGDTSP